MLKKSPPNSARLNNCLCIELAKANDKALGIGNEGFKKRNTPKGATKSVSS